MKKRARHLARDNAKLRMALRILIRQNDQLRMNTKQMMVTGPRDSVGTVSMKRGQDERLLIAEDSIHMITKEMSLLKMSFERLLKVLSENPHMIKSESENGPAALRVPPRSKCLVHEVVTRHPLTATTEAANRRTTSQEPSPPPLWTACDRQRIEEVRNLLRLGTTRDDPGPDGTTAFALSLAQLNTEQTLAILESGVEPREDILFCAKEFVKLQLSRPEEKALQSAVSSGLGGNIMPTSVSPSQYDERYISGHFLENFITI